MPYESCGVLFGDISGGTVRADGFAFLRNAAAQPEKSFRFDPEEWIQISYRAQKNQRIIVGFFHSHPYGSDRPSRQDGEGWDGSGTLWIADLSHPEAAIHVYALDSDLERRNRSSLQWYAIPLTICPNQ